MAVKPSIFCYRCIFSVYIKDILILEAIYFWIEREQQWEGFGPKLRMRKNQSPCLRARFEKEIWSLASLSCCSVTKQHFLVPFKAPAELSRGAIQQQGSADKYSRSSPYHQGVLWQAAQQPSKNSWSLKKTSSYNMLQKVCSRSIAPSTPHSMLHTICPEFLQLLGQAYFPPF